MTQWVEINIMGDSRLNDRILNQVFFYQTTTKDLNLWSLVGLIF